MLCLYREHAPSIIFMDEVDSIGSARLDSGGGGGDSEVQRTMLELLNQLDGFEATNKIKVTLADHAWIILSGLSNYLETESLQQNKFKYSLHLGTQADYTDAEERGRCHSGLNSPRIHLTLLLSRKDACGSA